MAAIDRVKESLDKAWDDEGNRLYHLRKAREEVTDLRRYIQSIEDANAAMMAEIRKNRGS